MPKVLLFSRQPLTSRPLQEWLDDTVGSVVLLTTPKAVRGAEDILAEHGGTDEELRFEDAKRIEPGHAP
jgi:hypothetical protein